MQIIERGRRVSGILLDTTPEQLLLRARRPTARRTGFTVTLGVVKANFAWGAPKPLPPEAWSGLKGAATSSANPQNYPNGCYVAEVEIEPRPARSSRGQRNRRVGTMINR